MNHLLSSWSVVPFRQITERVTMFDSIGRPAELTNLTIRQVAKIFGLIAIFYVLFAKSIARGSAYNEGKQ
ncbi:hypothetical protein [Paenibacillus sp. IITD108]|uniref:hypothetical protein n=1 Tax=Paenibacillus sp. IITD108 TaxID=3116649 RepID=UPI002F3ED03C